MESAQPTPFPVVFSQEEMMEMKNRRNQEREQQPEQVEEVNMEKLSMPADYDQGVDVSSSPPYAAAATTKKLLSKKATNVLDKIQVLIQDDGTNQHQQRQQLGDGETTTDASSSFSWDRDDDIPGGLGDEELKRKATSRAKSRCGACLNWYLRFPLPIRTVLYVATGWFLLLIPGLISLLLFSEPFTPGQPLVNLRPLKGQFAIGGIPFFNWSVWLGISWSSWWGFRYAFHVLPDMLVRLADVFIEISLNNAHYTEVVSHYVDYARFLKNYLAVMMWCVLNLITFSSILVVNDFNAAWWSYPFIVIQSLLTCVMALSILITIEKFFVQVFAVYFHKKVYIDRLAKDKYHFKVLDRLNNARKKSNPAAAPYSANSSNNNNLSPHDQQQDDNNISGGLANLSSSFSPSSFRSHKMDQIRNLKNKAVSEAVHVSKGVANVLGAAVGIRIGKTLGVVLRNTDDAKIFAKTLFIALTRGMGSYIVLEDFLPYFSKTLDAERAFSIFDKDGNGDISKREFKQGILEIYREHCFLETSLRHSSQAIGKLDNMLKIFMFIILLFICLSVFQVDTTKQMAALISIWVGSLFAIGGTIKDLVENLIFLFITHPYDTGDRVDIDGDSFTVKEFHLTTTILTRVDGKEIYAPNVVLSKKLIHNVRRSGPQSESIQLKIAINTPYSKITALKEHVVHYLEKEESREFFPKLGIAVSQIIDKSSMNISLNLEHKSNFQDGGARQQRKNRFMIKLIALLQELGIELIEPTV